MSFSAQTAEGAGSLRYFLELVARVSGYVVVSACAEGVDFWAIDPLLNVGCHAALRAEDLRAFAVEGEPAVRVQTSEIVSALSGLSRKDSAVAIEYAGDTLAIETRTPQGTRRGPTESGASSDSVACTDAKWTVRREVIPAVVSPPLEFQLNADPVAPPRSAPDAVVPASELHAAVTAAFRAMNQAKKAGAVPLCVAPGRVSAAGAEWGSAEPGSGVEIGARTVGLTMAARAAANESCVVRFYATSDKTIRLEFPIGHFGEADVHFYDCG